MSRRDFISYNTPEMCRILRTWSLYRTPSAPLRDWLPEHYKAVAVRVPVREELSEEETLLKEFGFARGFAL